MGTSTVLVIALICVAVGYAAGLLVGSVTARRKTSVKKEVIKPPVVVDETTQVEKAPQEAPAPVQPPAPPPVSPPRVATATTKPDPSVKNSLSQLPSIVQQIDDILQLQISNTDLYNRGIRLAETPEEGVTVWIGLNPYQGIDAVDDPVVKEAIQKAVKTWEMQAH